MLFITYQPWESQDKLGLPVHIQRTYTEEFNERKPMEALNTREWRRYNRYKDGVPIPEQFRLPAHMFMVCKGLRRLTTDLYSDGPGQWVISARFREFLQQRQLLAGYYEESALTVVSTKQEPLTQQPYFLLRFFRNDNDIVDFEATPKIISPKKSLTKTTPPTVYYSELIFRPGVQVPPMLFLDDPSYWYSLICTSEIKAAINQEQFAGFVMYTLPEYVQERLRREQIFAR